MQKRYWLMGLLAGLLIGFLVHIFIIPSFCSDFFWMGSDYPLEQPCYWLIVNGGKTELTFSLILVSTLMGVFYGKIKNRKKEQQVLPNNLK